MATKAKTTKAASKKIKAVKVVVQPAVSAATAEALAPVGKRNKSGFRGVYFSNRRQKFRATIKLVDGKRKRLGSFDTAEAASAAYEAAAAAQ